MRKDGISALKTVLNNDDPQNSSSIMYKNICKVFEMMED